MEKVFLVFNTACFGDVLLCNTLCQNIKLNYPDAKVVFITDKPFASVAEFQKDVDEVIVYDKRGVHKGFGGMLKFIKDFPYKKPYCSFLTYWNLRNYMVSLAIGAKHIISEDKKNPEPSAQKQHADLLSKITDAEIKNLPIKYNPGVNIATNCIEACGIVSEEGVNVANNCVAAAGVLNNCVAFCPVSKDISKDMSIETAINLIDMIKKSGYKVLFCGAGEKSVNYANELKDLGADFIDLTNKTTIPELGYVIKNSAALVSVDTGTMHMGCAVDAKTVVVFYKPEMTARWAPNPEIYKNTRLIKNNQSAENIYQTLCQLLEDKDV